jgi:hypothetical protein
MKVFVEFTTRIPPAAHPATATWYLPEGSYLPIMISGVFNGAGQPV